jgi:hypothetical protein
MRKILLSACATLLVLGCDQPTAPTPASATAATAAPALSVHANRRVVAAVTGHAVVDLTSAAAGYMDLFVRGLQRADGSSEGDFTETRANADGTVDFTGRVTCLAFDAVNHHAWVAGVITENRSTAPAFRDGEIFQPGMDIWFRVADYGHGHTDTPDRSTTFGFKGSAGINTSPEYCAAMLWPNTPVPDARTFPVSSGDITVHVK